MLAKSETVAIETKTNTIPWSNTVVFALFSIVGGLTDLFSKQWIFAWKGLPGEQPPSWLVEGYIGIETAVNEGALFGLGQGYGWLFAVLSAIASLGILVWLFGYLAIQSRWLTVAMACVMAGIIGNLYDRLGLWYQPGMPIEWKSAVRDWILFRYKQYTWPNFNIADSLLVCGAIMLGAYSIFVTEPKKQESTSRDSSDKTSSKSKAT